MINYTIKIFTPLGIVIDKREFDLPLTTTEKRILRGEYTADYPNHKGIDIIKENEK